MDWLVQMHLDYRVKVHKVPPNDGWRQWVIRFNVMVSCVPAPAIFSLLDSSTYYFAVDLSAFLILFFPLRSWCKEVSTKTIARWCKANGYKNLIELKNRRSISSTKSWKLNKVYVVTITKKTNIEIEETTDELLSMVFPSLRTNRNAGVSHGGPH